MGQCTAHSKRTGERCKRGCAPGYSVCYFHGQGAGTKKGQKHALKHGAYEVLTRETLTDEELKIIDQLDAVKPVDMLKEQIKMLKIKELRIARRMKQALLAELDAGKPDKDGGKKSAIVPLTISATKTRCADGTETMASTTNSETHEMHYLRLDSAHTVVMNELRRAMANLAEMEAELGVGEDAPLPLYTLPPKEENAKIQ